MCGPSLVVTSGDYSSLWGTGFLLWRLVLLWSTSSLACGLSTCGLRMLKLEFSSSGAQAWLLCGMWDLPRLGIEPVSPELAGEFLTTRPQGKPRDAHSWPLTLDPLNQKLWGTCGLGFNQPFRRFQCTLRFESHCHRGKVGPGAVVGLCKVTVLFWAPGVHGKLSGSIAKAGTGDRRVSRQRASQALWVPFSLVPSWTFQRQRSVMSARRLGRQPGFPRGLCLD